MASIVNFACRPPWQTICSIHIKRTSQLVHLKMEQQKISLSRLTLKKPFKNQRFNMIQSLAAADSDDITLNHHLSAAEMIKMLYTCINEKRLKEIEGYISDDCNFEECSFVSPLQGKKEIMHFYQLLTSGMGHNVKFSIEHVCEDGEFTAGVNWHLEWKKRRIPFTRGCSFYQCSTKGDKLVIKKAQILIESPIKPGGLALILLKNVIAIFDDFPSFAEWFLKSPHVIVQFLLKVYSRLLAPIVNPLLAGYIRIWNFIAQMFACALRILLYISKKYFQ